MHKTDKEFVKNLQVKRQRIESEEILLSDTEENEETANLEENADFQTETNVVKKYKNRK